jgi:hypothetical protein
VLRWKQETLTTWAEWELDTLCLNGSLVCRSDLECLARQDTMPFYKPKSTVYSVWFMGGLHRILGQSLHCKAHGILHHKAQMSKGAQRCACSTTVATWLHNFGDHVNPCARINARAWSRPRGRRLPNHWVALTSLTGLRAIDWVWLLQVHGSSSTSTRTP